MNQQEEKVPQREYKTFDSRYVKEKKLTEEQQLQNNYP